MESSVAHHQEIGRANSMENMLVSDSKQNQQERKTKVPQQEQALKCPRCDSINTKFCYYNNYSLSQPRYFCKSCRRYWTKGGTLRNVPVGGGCRKTKRSLSSSSSSSNSKKTQFDDHTHLNPNYDSIDLNLAFARLQKQSNGQLGFDHYDHEFSSILGNPQFDILGNPNGFYGNLGEVETYCGDQMILPYNYKASTDQAATMKQELSDFGSEKSKILYGFPWINGGIGEFDYGRESTSWNNIHGISGSSSSWHGVLNSPLM